MGNQTSADDMNMARHKFDDDPKKNVKNFPNRTGRATYDALTGFPQGRKERVMVATIQEMEDAHVPLDKRDYCAHLYIAWKKCHMENMPWGKAKCKPQIHEYTHCEHEDFLLRKKEYERERRLRERENKKLQAASQNAEVEIQ